MPFSPAISVGWKLSYDFDHVNVASMSSYPRHATPCTSALPSGVLTVLNSALTVVGRPNKATAGYSVYTPTSLRAPAVPGLKAVATSPLLRASYFVEYWQKCNDGLEQFHPILRQHYGSLDSM